MLRFVLLGLLAWLVYRLATAGARKKQLEAATRRALADAKRAVGRGGPHEVLGVPSDASAEEVRRAYRALAKKHHPDVVPEDEREAAEARMRTIQAAYDALSKR